MRPLALILALLPCVAAAQSLDDAVTGGYSAVASRYQWGSTGGDWPVPPEAPAPIVDCNNDFRDGKCGATTFVASGTPALASTYWRPGGGAMAGSGVAFDDSGDKFTAAKTLSGTFLVCYRGSISIITGRNNTMAAEWGTTAAEKGWYLEVNGANLASFGTSAAAATITPATSIGTQNVMCGAYVDGGGSAANTLLLNLNGTAASATTTTDIVASTAALVIGYGWTYAGSMGALKVWDFVGNPWQPTVAEMTALMAAMVRSQYAAQGSLGEPLTVTRASSKSCSIGGQWFTVPANQPCIGDAGLSVEGSRTQYALNNCTAPADQTVTLAAGAHTLWLDGTGTVAAAVGAATATGLPCTATAATACSFTISVGGTVTLDVTGTVDRMQVENGAKSSLICATTTPVTRAADVLSFPIPAGALWAVYTLNGTRTALDLTGNTTPLTIGVGQELAITGNVTDLLFCYAPDSSECQ